MVLEKHYTDATASRPHELRMYEPSIEDLASAALIEAREQCEAAPRDRRLKLVEHLALELNRGDFYRLLGEQWTAFSHLRWHAQFLRDHPRRKRRVPSEELVARHLKGGAKVRVVRDKLGMLKNAPAGQSTHKALNRQAQLPR